MKKLNVAVVGVGNIGKKHAKIYDEFNEVKVAHRSKILNYFITRKLKTLIEVIDEF